MIYVQYVLAFVAVIQMFLIIDLFGRTRAQMEGMVRLAKVCADLKINLVNAINKHNQLIAVLADKESHDNQQQSSTDHQK
ncbi:hypothetical protein [Pseudomonas phage 98PfluR60PP]|uniref:Uncharacterized protein n=1 Tax=Pseudomonas phage 98PfluR60PP TaxID=2163965 RepID=A0A2S1PG15_9CAUD|nr:hypothetical protein PP760_gp76 [Pseudomonas phage 98PfluR60PP]AWH15508.1 hypothetical protein [Pseudomonas phage 98PfluR60PP]